MGLLRRVVHAKLIHGVTALRRGSHISHRFLADDSLLFCRASAVECKNASDILRHNEMLFGQQINLDKSTIYFNPNTSNEVKNEIK